MEKRSKGRRVVDFLWRMVLYVLCLFALIIFFQEIMEECFRRGDESNADMSML